MTPERIPVLDGGRAMSVCSHVLQSSGTPRASRRVAALEGMNGWRKTPQMRRQSRMIWETACTSAGGVDFAQGRESVMRKFAWGYID